MSKVDNYGLIILTGLSSQDVRYEGSRSSKTNISHGDT